MADEPVLVAGLTDQELDDLAKELNRRTKLQLRKADTKQRITELQSELDSYNVKQNTKA